MLCNLWLTALILMVVRATARCSCDGIVRTCVCIRCSMLDYLCLILVVVITLLCAIVPPSVVVLVRLPVSCVCLISSLVILVLLLCLSVML